jgi:flagellar hook-associated protein 2
MGSITTGIGLISGIDTATLIDSLITLASGPKFNLQNRLAVLQSQQAALLDVNARLLNLKNTSAGLRTNNVFRSALATSGDGEVLTATPTGAAVQPGTYSFLVKQIVSNSQKISRGFTDADTTPGGLTSLSFELGKGKLSTDTDLGDLNAATGVRRGKIEITDSADDSAIIDLSAATTINEVLDAINSNTTVDVTASAEGDHLVITDNAGGAGDMEITDATGYFTATDLGINKTAVAGTITGDDIRTLGSLTPLSFLNDGTGVYLDDGSYDFKITTRSGREFDIDLGRINNPITGDTLIEDLNGGAGVTLNADSTEDIQFIDRDGVEHDVDLTGIVTVQDFIDRVNDQTDGAITITVHADGDKFTVTDTTGGAGKLKVLGAGPNETDTAEDLGILEETGVDAATFDGTALVNADHTPAAKTIQDVIDRINDAWDNEAVPVQNGGHIVASIAADGVSLQLQDTVGGGPAANFTVTASPTNAYAARDLGIEKTGDAGGIIDGDRLIAGINSVLVRSLNGGAGIGGDSNLIIQDRNGDGDAFVIDPDSSVTDIVDQINASAFIDVTASLNDAGNGLLITDNTGATISNLIVTGDVADDLGIDTGVLGVDADFYRGDNVQLRYVAEATNLADLNYGRGINLGQFRITDGHGDQVTIDVDSDLESVYDLIEQINTQAGIYDVDVTARVNDSGDGIQLDNDLGTGLIKVETISGTTAADLNLLGQAEAEGDPIDGTYETTIALNASDTIDQHRRGGHAHPDGAHLRAPGHAGRPRARRRGVRPGPGHAVRGQGREGVLRLRGPGAGDPHQAVLQYAQQRRAGRQHRPGVGERHAGHPHRQPRHGDDQGQDRRVRGRLQRRHRPDRPVRLLRHRDGGEGPPAGQLHDRPGPQRPVPDGAAEGDGRGNPVSVSEPGRAHRRRRGHPPVRPRQVPGGVRHRRGGGREPLHGLPGNHRHHQRN